MAPREMKKAKVIDFSRGEAPPADCKGTIGVVKAMRASDVVRLAHVSNFSHIVQRDGLAFENELKTAQSMTENVVQFLRDPLSVIFGPQPSDKERDSMHVVSPVTEKKTRTLEQFEEFVKTIKGARRIREQALLVADELYTNAMKTGHPHDKMSSAQFAREGTVEFFAEHDGHRLVLGCRDSFGELGFSQVLTRISHCFDRGVVHSINNGEGGAGIGSFMVFNTCISYYCGVDKGRTTVVCVALPLGVSDDQLAALPKNIHLVSA
jgi:hypothetical protein